MEQTYTTIRDEGALVRVPTAFDNDSVVICGDRVIEHHNTEQAGSMRYSCAAVSFADVYEVRPARDAVVLAYSEKPGDGALFRFGGIRPAQAFERCVRAGIAAHRGDGKAAREFDKRIAKLREQHGEDTAIRVRDVVAPSYDPAKQQLWDSLVLASPEDGERLIALLERHPKLPGSRIVDRAEPLPLMLVAYWNLDAGDGYMQVGYRLGDPTRPYDRDGWSFCPHDGFHYGLYAYDEERARADIAEAVDNGRTVYLEDLRTHENIRYLRSSPIIRS